MKPEDQQLNCRQLLTARIREFNLTCAPRIVDALMQQDVGDIDHQIREPTALRAKVEEALAEMRRGSVVPPQDGHRRLTAQEEAGLRARAASAAEMQAQSLQLADATRRELQDMAKAATPTPFRTLEQRQKEYIEDVRLLHQFAPDACPRSLAEAGERYPGVAEAAAAVRRTGRPAAAVWLAAELAILSTAVPHLAPALRACRPDVVPHGPLGDAMVQLLKLDEAIAATPEPAPTPAPAETGVDDPRDQLHQAINLLAATETDSSAAAAAVAAAAAAGGREEPGASSDSDWAVTPVQPRARSAQPTHGNRDDIAVVDVDASSDSRDDGGDGNRDGDCDGDGNANSSDSDSGGGPTAGLKSRPPHRSRRGREGVAQRQRNSHRARSVSAVRARSVSAARARGQPGGGRRRGRSCEPAAKRPTQADWDERRHRMHHLVRQWLRQAGHDEDLTEEVVQTWTDRTEDDEALVHMDESQRAQELQQVVSLPQYRGRKAEGVHNYEAGTPRHDGDSGQQQPPAGGRRQ